MTTLLPTYIPPQMAAAVRPENSPQIELDVLNIFGMDRLKPAKKSHPVSFVA